MANSSIQRDPALERCIADCFDCHRSCFETIQHCLRTGGIHAQPPHIGLLLNCAELCQAGAQFMLTGSPFQNRVCQLCSEVCSACADDCERLGSDDEMMRKCAESCRRCAASCKVMSQTVRAA